MKFLKFADRVIVTVEEIVSIAAHDTIETSIYKNGGTKYGLLLTLRSGQDHLVFFDDEYQRNVYFDKVFNELQVLSAGPPDVPGAIRDLQRIMQETDT